LFWQTKRRGKKKDEKRKKKGGGRGKGMGRIPPTATKSVGFEKDAVAYLEYAHFLEA